jgi:hypothetical protein
MGWQQRFMFRTAHELDLYTSPFDLYIHLDFSHGLLQNVRCMCHDNSSNGSSPLQAEVHISWYTRLLLRVFS